MKNTKTLLEKVDEIIKQYNPSKKMEKENLEFVDINKSIEKMLSAKSNHNSNISNLLK